ncbi:MAG: transposase [Candidatus Binataceae bacterium]
MLSGRWGGGAAVGETQEQPFQLSFNSSLKVDFQGSRVTSDGGLVLVRELDERLGFGELIARHLADSRGKNTQLPLADLLRQSVYTEHCTRRFRYRLGAVLRSVRALSDRAT